MANGATKEVFADLGVEVDLAQLVQAEAKLEQVIGVFDRLADVVTAAVDRLGAITDLTAVLKRVEHALGDTGDESEELAKDVDKAADKFDELEHGARAAGHNVDRLGDDAKKAEPKVESLGDEIGDMVGKLAAFAAGKEALDWLVELGRESDFTARRLGVTTEQVALLRSVARSSGVELEDVQDVIVTFGERMRDAVLAPTSDAAQQLEALGIAVPASTEDIPDSMALLDTLADSLAGIENPSERAAAAATLLGDVGVRLLPSLEKGSRGIEEMEERVHKLGGGFTGAGAESAKRFNDALNDLKTFMESFAARVIDRVSRALDGLGFDFAEISEDIFDVLDQGRLLEVALGGLTIAFGVFGATAFAAWVAATWPAILAGAAIAAILLVVEDLTVGMEGGQSAIFAWIDSFAGVGTARGFIESMKFVFEALWIAIKTVGDYMSEVLIPVFKAFFTGDYSGLMDSLGNFGDSLQERFGELRRANEQASARVRASRFVQEGFNARNAAAATVNQNSTTNLNVTASPGMEQIAAEVQRVVRVENDRAQRDVRQGLEEAAQ